MQLLLCSKTQPIDSVGPAVGPLTKLLGCLGERHAGCDSAIDNCLQMQITKVIITLCCSKTHGQDRCLWETQCGRHTVKWRKYPALVVLFSIIRTNYLEGQRVNVWFICVILIKMSLMRAGVSKRNYFPSSQDKSPRESHFFLNINTYNYFLNSITLKDVLYTSYDD